MKTLFLSGLLLSAALVLPLRAANSADGKKEHTFLGLVVAEQPGRDSSSTIGNSTPTPALVFDGGYIEGGDAIAGDRPPTPQTVAAAVSAALRSRNFTIDNGQSGANPAMVLTYHWGVLRRRHWHDISLSNLNSNLKARLSLVARYDTVRDLEQYILTDRAAHGASHAFLEQPTYLDARQNAQDPRYFIILTAYDFNALKNQQAKPIWRVKMSTLETSGSMANVVPALAVASSPYFGQNLPRAESVRVSEHVDVSADNSAPSFTLTDDSANGLDQKFVEQLLKHEHTEFTGEDQTDWDEANWGK